MRTIELNKSTSYRTLYYAVFILFLLATANGCAGLVNAASKGDAGTVRSLLKSGTPVDQIGPNGLTALNWAVMGNHIEVVRILVENGANLNHSTSIGFSPLHGAARDNRVEIARILIDAGADLERKVYSGTWKGWTPLKFAQAQGNAEIEKILIDAGAKRIAAYKITKQRDERRTIPAQSPSAFTQPQGANAQSKGVSPSSAPQMKYVSRESINFGSYHALIIGNNNYQYLPKLGTAINDAKTIGKLLHTKYAFKVKLLTDATRAELLMALSSFRKTLTPNDNLLIYYAGHGWLDTDADQGYWLPINATKENKIEWISNNTITSEIRAVQAKHIIVVADSCYSGKLTRGLHISHKTPDYLSRISQKKARVVLSSGGLEPVLDSGGKGEHSIFASAFIESLTENTDVVDGTTLFAKIREQVGWNADQIPEYANIHKAGHDGGDFVFVRAH